MTTKYTIHESKTGALLTTVEAGAQDVARIENLSSDNAEGHFSATRLSDLDCCEGVDLGDRSVYMLVH